MPVDYSKYPSNWKTEIRPRILARDQNRCRLCLVPNYAVGYRDKNGGFYSAEEIMNALEDHGRDYFDEDGPLGHIDGNQKPIRIVLTIAHWDHDLSNNDDSNLMALCQRCHLRHDKDQHKQSREKNRGLQKLF